MTHLLLGGLSTGALLWLYSASLACAWWYGRATHVALSVVGVGLAAAWWGGGVVAFFGIFIITLAAHVWLFRGELSATRTVLLSFALGFMVEASLLITIGSQAVFPATWSVGHIWWGFVALGLGVLAGLWILIYTTKTGLLWRAQGESPNKLLTRGVRPMVPLVSIWAVSLALASVAGVLTTGLFVLQPHTGWSYLLPAFASVVAVGRGQWVLLFVLNILFGVLGSMAVGAGVVAQELVLLVYLALGGVVYGIRRWA